MIILKFILTIILTYYFAAVVQTTMHRAFGHHNRIQVIYETHSQGHHAKYPPQKLTSDQFEDAEQQVMWYYAFPFVPTGLLVFWLGGSGILAGYVTGLLFAVWWHTYLHEQYHLNHSFWHRFVWFQQKRELHLIHHCHARQNYAIVEYWIDRIMGTYKDKDRKEV